MNNVIDFQEAKARRIYERELAECIDTHEAVLDLSDAVPVEDHFHNVTVTNDSIIIHTIGKSKEESDTEI